MTTLDRYFDLSKSGENTSTSKRLRAKPSAGGR